MAEQVLIQFRADKALKQEVAEIYESLGMDLPTAFRMFMTRSKMVKGLPFEATLPQHTVTRTEAKNAFYELRRQAALRSTVCIYCMSPKEQDFRRKSAPRGAYEKCMAKLLQNA